ncbi:hypothetical protein V6N13_116499 [Hibiscus sabdariffa]
MLQHLGVLCSPHLGVGVCWASSAPTFLPLRSTRLDLPVRLLACPLDVLFLPQRAVWCAQARIAAYHVVWLLVVATVVAERGLAGPTRCCPRPFSCRASIPFPWHASFSLVPQFASPRIVAWLLALDVSARPHYWPLLCVPTIIAFISSSFASMARPSRWLLTCGSRFGSPWAAAPTSDPVVPVVAAHATRAPPTPVVASDAANLQGPSAPSETADLV